MDEFPGLLSREFGFRPQGRSAPMAASRGPTAVRSTASVPLPSFTTTPSTKSTLLDDPSSTGLGDLDGIFGGISSKPVNSSSSSVNYDSMFDGFNNPVPSKMGSKPVYDKPVYDDDLFDGVPGLKPSSAAVNDVFASLSLGSNHVSSREDDLLGDLSGKEQGSGISEQKTAGFAAEQSIPGFDDLIPGFGGSIPPQKREHSDADLRHSSSNPNLPTATMSSDPFVDLESTSVPSYPSSGLFVDPHHDINVPLGKMKSNASSGLFDDLNAFNGLKRSTSPISSNTSDNQKDKKTLNTAEGKNRGRPTAVEEFTERFSAKTSADLPKKSSCDIHNESELKVFDIPTENLDYVTSEGRFGSQTADSDPNQFEMNSKEHSRMDDDIWLTVSEIPLFTQPTSAPPPSRRPPPFVNKKAPFTYKDKGASAKSQTNANFPFSQHTKEYMPSEPFGDSPKTFGVSSIDELENFAMAKPRAYADERTEGLSEEDNETSTAAANSAAVMKEAMDRAEAKMRQARELRERERETRTNKSREYLNQGKKDKAASNFYDEEHKETFETFDPEQEQMEREEKEREQRKLERERQRELQREREKAAVEKALREARERAAAEARQKAERAAVEKANAEARERAARAAVQRATAEKREKEAAEARDRAAAEARAAAESRERAAAEAKERAAREAREREAREREVRERDVREREAKEKAAAMNRERERAAVQRAATEARRRHERAAVERANEESRQRAAAAAREKQRKNENDLDSFFGTGNRANSEPKQRAASADVSFDAQAQNKGASAGVRVASSNSSSASSNMRKTASTNILDDLTSVFGGASASDEFQDIDGESEERRRARLERHQRTLERAAKALAEKNERDMQVQREQVERDRIAESLDVEIRRWAAGKEGNLRALLSTLQYILWPGCGWQPVSLTDLITSASVKKIYRKATLHIHPDKVQQKGANLEQKIIAEKVFDLLKEAWNKFNSEELF